MRDDFQFAVLGVIAICLVAAEVILAVTNSGPTELHAALLIVLGGLLGVAGTNTRGQVIEQAARTLVIDCFTAGPLPPDLDGIALMLSRWIGMPRPGVWIRDGRYTITCATPQEAKTLCANFGGTVKGRNVSGYIVDLTS